MEGNLYIKAINFIGSHYGDNCRSQQMQERGYEALCCIAAAGYTVDEGFKIKEEALGE